MSEENEKAYRDALSQLDKKKGARDERPIRIDSSAHEHLRVLMKLMDWNAVVAVNSALSFFFSDFEKHSKLILEETNQANDAADRVHTLSSIEAIFEYTAKNESRLNRYRADRRPEEFDSIVIAKALKLLYLRLTDECRA